jgi:fatty acid desaturase
MPARKPEFVFAYSYWDAVPVAFGLLHAAFVVLMFLAFRQHAPWWVMGMLGVVYAYSITWNINGISHNFIHNAYFKSPILNRAFSLLESVTMGFSQQFYNCVHDRHHQGNSDRQDANGQTIDWLSIYRHGHDGLPESVWTYTFLSYFRDDVFETYRELKRRRPADAYFGCVEIGCTVAAFILGFILSWKFMLFFIPFYYLGHSLSSLNGYYKHYGSDPDKPIAWGVSSYDFFYNLVWFNNGYHAEHHYRPKTHWTEMKQLHEKIKDDMRAAGTRVIKPPHPFGFLDPDLPPRVPPKVASPEKAV